MVRLESILVVVLFASFGICGCNRTNESAQLKSGIKADKAILRSGPAIEIKEKEIDLGTIPVEENMVIGQIFFSNVGSEVLEISKVFGPCNCFAGYTGDKSLQPGQDGLLEVKFDKNKLPSGDVKRFARVYSNDPENKIVKVNFSFNVQRSQAEEDMMELKGELSSIRREIKVLQNDVKSVLDELQKKQTAQEQIKKSDTCCSKTL